jgi:hypothetical protein
VIEIRPRSNGRGCRPGFCECWFHASPWSFPAAGPVASHEVIHPSSHDTRRPRRSMGPGRALMRRETSPPNPRWRGVRIIYKSSLTSRRYTAAWRGEHQLPTQNATRASTVHHAGLERRERCPFRRRPHRRDGPDSPSAHGRVRFERFRPIHRECAPCFAGRRGTIIRQCCAACLP